MNTITVKFYLLVALYAIVLLGFLNACTSSQKQMERGNYMRAATMSIDKLCTRPDDSQAAEVLRESYPLAMQQLDAQIQSASNAVSASSMLISKWDELISLYQSVNQYDERIRRCPAASSVIASPKNYQIEMREAMRRAAQIHCQLGSEKLALNRRELSQEIVNHFRKTQEYAPEMCPDALQKMELGRLMGIMKVLVEQLPVQGYYAPSDEFFRNQINTYLLTLRKTNQLDFYYEALAMPMNPNQILRFQFYDFTVGETTNRERIETVSDTVRTTNQEQKVTNTQVVTAELRTYEKSVRSNAVLEIKILDEDNQRVLLNERIPSEYIWTSTWATYQGDKRALNAAQLELCNQREQPVPDRQFLFTEMCKPLLDQLKPRLQEFYRNVR